MRCYITVKTTTEEGKEIKELTEVSEAEYLALVGNKIHSPYATKVYTGKITLDDVPEEYRETVNAIVQKRIEFYGAYEDHDISANELKTMIEEVI